MFVCLATQNVYLQGWDKLAMCAPGVWHGPPVGSSPPAGSRAELPRVLQGTGAGKGTYTPRAKVARETGGQYCTVCGHQKTGSIGRLWTRLNLPEPGEAASAVQQCVLALNR